MKFKTDAYYTYNIVHRSRSFGRSALQSPFLPNKSTGDYVGRQAFLFQHYISALSDKFRRAFFYAFAGLFGSGG
ncbi:MAG: hypothetical protein LBD21_10975, partial [Tannerellaceae bacterium]|nr:hypothetical protein [Tannerellaceae bacterium]